MNTEESAENYLETILLLHKADDKVRAVDIARERGFSKPTVSIALKKLLKKEYVRVLADSSIVLTDSGRKIAEKIYERHRVITDLLVKIGVDEKTAAQDACKIEHDLSDESFDKLKAACKNFKA